MCTLHVIVAIDLQKIKNKAQADISNIASCSCKITYSLSRSSPDPSPQPRHPTIVYHTRHGKVKIGDTNQRDGENGEIEGRIVLFM